MRHETAPLTPDQQTLVESGIRFAWRQAIRFVEARRIGEEADDFAQAAMMGLIYAAQRFDPNRPHPTKPGERVKFLTYAGWWVHQHLQRQLIHRNPVGPSFAQRDGRALKVTPAVFPIDEKLDVPDRVAEIDAELDRPVHERRYRRMISALRSINERTAEFVERHFIHGESFASIGASHGVSRSRAEQVCRDGIRRLRKLAAKRRWSRFAA